MDPYAGADGGDDEMPGLEGDGWMPGMPGMPGMGEGGMPPGFGGQPGMIGGPPPGAMGGPPPGMMPGGPGGPPMQGGPQRIAIPPEAIKHFVMVYPAYLDETLTVAQGRRLPKRHLAGCVAINPYDILEAAETLGYRNIAGPPAPGTANPVLDVNLVPEFHKRYPRDDFRRMGRVRIQLKRKDGSYVIPAIDSKEKLLRELGRVIPTLESRRLRNEELQRRREAVEAELARRAASQPRKIDKKEKKAKAAAQKGGKA